MLLDIHNVTKMFGGVSAVRNVTMQVEEHRISAIIGPNGAGKTTLFNLLTGIYRPDSGGIVFEGRSLIGLRPDQVNATGIARTFQSIRLFPTMTVLENVMVGMHSRLNVSLATTLLRTPHFNKQEIEVREKSSRLIRFVGLAGKGDEISRNLPYGDQRRLELARALASDPRLILLDEPTAGMNPQETAEAMKLFRRVRDELGVTVVLIEHDMKVVMGISEHITVLDYGEKIAEGSPAEIRSNPRVIEAYLGRSVAEETGDLSTEDRRFIQLADGKLAQVGEQDDELSETRKPDDFAQGNIE